MPLRFGLTLSSASQSRFGAPKDSKRPEALLAGSAAMPPQGSVEAVDQSNSVERLGQEGNCSGLQHSRTDGLFGEGRDEDEWHAVPLGKQEGLQLDTAHGRHLDIRNHARRIVEVGRSQELLG